MKFIQTKITKYSLAIFILLAAFFFLKPEPASACTSLPIGGDYTTNASCAFPGTINGIDNGNFTIADGHTLTINAGQTIVWNSGKTLTINGAIAINKAGGAQLRKTNLWMIDADADNYPTSLTQIAQDDAPTGGRRRNLMTQIAAVDCNDTNAALLVNGYADGDGDGYGAGELFCGGAVANGDDCYDANANANPAGQWSITHRGDGSWDFNCDSTETKANPVNCTEAVPRWGWCPSVAIPVCGVTGLDYCDWRGTGASKCIFSFAGSQDCK